MLLKVSFVLIFSLLYNIIFRWVYNYHTYWRRHGIKGPNLWQSMLSYTKVLPENDWKLYEKYGDVIGFYEIFKKGLIINDPKLIKDIYIKDFHLFTNRRNYCFGNFYDSGILLARDDNWRRIRSVVGQAFTSSKIKAMFGKVAEKADQFCHNISEEAPRGVFDLKYYINGYVMDVICSCGYGIDIESVKNPNHPIVVNATKIFGIDLDITKVLGFVWPQLGKLLNFQVLHSDAVIFFGKLSEKLINDRKEKKSGQMQDLMQLLIDANQQTDNIPLTLDEITATVVTIFIGGFDTTAATLSHVCYYLAQNKECQQTLFEELSAIENFNYKTLSKCKYMNAVIREASRMAPVGCRIDREAAQDYVLGDTGIVVPKGCLMTISPNTVHHRPDLFVDPNKFNPNRFLDESLHFDESTELNWGIGPRMCNGVTLAMLEMRVLIYKLITMYHISLPSDIKLEYPRGNMVYLPKKVLVMANRRSSINSKMID